jgi:hypothetical protein
MAVPLTAHAPPSLQAPWGSGRAAEGMRKRLSALAPHSVDRSARSSKARDSESAGDRRRASWSQGTASARDPESNRIAPAK